MAGKAMAQVVEPDARQIGFGLHVHPASGTCQDEGQD